MTGFVDLGFGEISSSTGTNDTFHTVDIAVYPDGVTKSQIHYETNMTE
jgi:hypothetical protein